MKFIKIIDIDQAEGIVALAITGIGCFYNEKNSL